jgi:CubicO group peptidase (beta-lactamase class C family)
MKKFGDAMSIVQGYTTDNFSSLRDVLEQQLNSGEDVGASIAVILRGELVADIWGGYTDEEMIKPWERDTILNVWSVTKTMTFLVALMLSDRGELDFDAPVAKYWPEFAQRGKELDRGSPRHGTHVGTLWFRSGTEARRSRRLGPLR